MSAELVAIIGASPKEERYSYKAMNMLADKGHTPILIAPARSEIEGRPVYARLSDFPEACSTIVMYIGPARQEEALQDIIAAQPTRVIFNPGTENPSAYTTLQAAGIETLEACTLVLLSTGQF